MTDQQLHRALRALHEEIDRSAGIDDASRRRLERLADAIEQKLDQARDAGHHQHMVELLRDEVAYLEVSHPRLTEALNEIVTILSAGGM